MMSSGNFFNKLIKERLGYSGYERLWPLFRVIVMIFEDECNNFESDIEIQGKKLG